MTAKKSSVTKLPTQEMNNRQTKPKEPIQSADGKKWYIKYRLRNGLGGS